MDLAYFEVCWRLNEDKETQRDELLLKTDKRMRGRDGEIERGRERGRHDKRQEMRAIATCKEVRVRHQLNEAGSEEKL